MKMGNIRNIYDLYTIEEIKRVSEVFRTYDCKYIPVALKAPNCVSKVYRGRKQDLPYEISSFEEWYTLKFYYALQVWLMTIAVFNNKRGTSTNSGLSYNYGYKWVSDDSCFNKLISDNENYETLVQKFWGTLETIADSGAIKVVDGISYVHKRNNFCFTDLDVITQVVVDVEEFNNSYNYNSIFSYALKSVTYSWKEIKKYFVELSLKDLALLDGTKINKCSSKDKILFNACNRLNFQDVVEAVKNGANIHSMDEEGRTCISSMLEEIYTWDREDTSTDEFLCLKSSMAREIIKYLISQGADLNEFGYGGFFHLECAVMNHDYEMTKYLLENGVNPNYDTFIDDIMCLGYTTYVSRALDIACTEDYLEDDENTQKIYNLLIDYGAKLFTDEELKLHPDWKNPKKILYK